MKEREKVGGEARYIACLELLYQTQSCGPQERECSRVGEGAARRGIT